ncbi:MAG: Glycerol-3-phosphate responsive antiterminator [Lachnoclostridium sp.]|jgi:glycerol uptake operon antiterminator
MNFSLEKLLQSTAECPIIAAVKNFEGLEKCKETDCRIVFILFGDICNISDIVNKVKEMGKYAIVHVDLIAGLGSKEVAIDYIKQSTRADGIISTKPALIKRAKELSLFTIQRSFLIDSLAYDNLKKQVQDYNPDVIEILPGSLYKVINILCKEIKTPLIAGGLIMDKADVIAALKAGAIAVSSTNQKVWSL